MPKKFNIKAYDDDSSDDYIDMSDVKYKVLSSKQSLQTRRDSRMSRDRKKRSKSSKKGSNTESVVSQGVF